VLRSLSKVAKISLNQVGLTVSRVDPLTQIANKWRTDKGSAHYSRHYYSRWYHHFFHGLRDAPVVLIELGLCRPDFDRRRAGNLGSAATATKAFATPSLSAWADYFRKGRILGFDIDDFTAATGDRIEVVQGDVFSAEDLDRLLAAAAEPPHIVIDDASHLWHHQQFAFGHLFPHLRPGGIYVIEDLYFGGDAQITRNTRSVLKEFIATGALRSDYIAPERGLKIGEMIAQVVFADSLEQCSEEHMDAIAFVFKKPYCASAS